MHYVKVMGILSPSNGMNLYRGCSHGCIYCDSRSKCYQMNHDFEDIEVKENALELLEAALRRKRKRCMIGTGAMTELQTKSDLVLRDLDILRQINEKTKAVVQMTLTTADEKLCRIIEPNVSTTNERFEALKALRDAGIPTVVWLCPVLPFINDTEENIRTILGMCVEAGVRGVLCFGMGLTLREGNREYFYRQLDIHFPRLKERYIREYGNNYMVDSPRSTELMRLFHRICEENGILHSNDQIFEYLRKFEEKNAAEQLCLW